jgi:cation-transporting ATPase 13A1
MSITPYNVQAFRDGKWQEVISSELVPGDLVSVCTYHVLLSVSPLPCAKSHTSHLPSRIRNLLADRLVRTKPDSGIPCDLLLLRGTCIVNEAMLSGESTPLLKESVELREGADKLDMNGADRNSVLFSGTKALQVEKAGEGGITSELIGSLHLQKGISERGHN